MYKFTKLSDRWISVSILLILSGLLSACAPEPAPQTANLWYPEDVKPNELIEIEPHNDEIGRYIVAASASVEGADGVHLKLEERFYLDFTKVRFVVTQRSIVIRENRIGIAKLDITVHSDAAVILQKSMLDELRVQPVPAELFATELYGSARIGDGTTTQPCAVVELSYEEASWFPRVLSTCGG